MAKVYITEYANSGRELKQNIVQSAEEPRLADQVVAIGGSSVQSAALQDKTRLIRVHTDAICSIDIGADPTATANKSRMGANQTEYFSISKDAQAAGDVKIAVITNT